MFKPGRRLRIFCVIFYLFAFLLIISKNGFMLLPMLCVWIDGVWNWRKVRQNPEKPELYDKVIESLIWPLVVLLEWPNFDQKSQIHTEETLAPCWHCFGPQTLVDVKMAICHNVDQMPADENFISTQVAYCPRCGVKPHSIQINCKSFGNCPYKDCIYRN